MSSHKLSAKIFGVVVIIILIVTALAPVFYALAPQYVPVPPAPATVDTSVESVTTE
jgi:hypothetical protein